MLIAGLLVLAVVFVQAGCGGGSTSSPGPTPPPSGGTPVGSFTVTVLANSGSVQHSTPVTLVVQ